METRGVIAAYDAAAESFTLTISSQGVHSLRDTLANQVLKVDPAKVRVITPDVGGGFGTKSFMYREYALAAEAARRLGRPVKWVADRMDHFTGDSQGRDNFSTGEVALSADGRFLAMRFDILANLGAYLSQFGPYIPYLGATMMTGVYGTPPDPCAGARRLHPHRAGRRLSRRRAARGRLPPRAPRRPCRARARGEARSDPAAELHPAPADALQDADRRSHLRHRRFPRPHGQGPWSSPIGRGFKERLRASRKARKLRGIGLATYIECTAWGEGEDAQVRLEEDGTVTVFSGTQSNGQGHATAYAQFAAEHLDVPLDRIRVVQGDTARVRTGNGTGGSRSIPIGGVSVGAASQDLARKLKELASDELEAAAADLEIADGAVRVVGTDRRIAFPELARLPGATEEARTGAASFVPPDATYPNGTHIAEVEIDPDTGVTALTRYTVCDDFGRAVNPLLLEGQVHGGVVQGIGQALHERTVYDAEGQLLTASFMDYALPRAEDVPFLRFETRNVPSTTNPLGIKGAGEAGSIGSCPAVMNAVVDALDRGHGLRDIDMPATPHAIRKALATR